MQGDAKLSEAQTIEEVNEDEGKYIVFSLGGELYGTKLLSVREVIEAMPTKALPNTIPSFLGVCNLRGQIIGVIDLRIRFGVTAPPAERPIFLVFETSSGLIGAAVDRIVSVTEIPDHQVETKPNIVCAVPARYIQGIGKWDDRLVTLIELRDILSHEELANASASKLLLKNQEERRA